jgi:hypothetical protein
MRHNCGKLGNIRASASLIRGEVILVGGEEGAPQLAGEVGVLKSRHYMGEMKKSQRIQP